MPFPQQPKYWYRRRGEFFIVYEMEYTGTVTTGTPVAEYHTEKEAKGRVYELNGWKKKMKIK